MASDNKTSDRGFASKNWSEADKQKAREKGGEASSTSSTQGAAGKTEAAKRGGEHSHKNQNS